MIMYDLYVELMSSDLTLEQVIIELIKQKRTLENNMELCCSKFPNFKEEYLADIKECQELILETLNELDESCFEFEWNYEEPDREVGYWGGYEVTEWIVDLGEVKLSNDDLGLDVYDLHSAYDYEMGLNNE